MYHHFYYKLDKSTLVACTGFFLSSNEMYFLCTINFNIYIQKYNLYFLHKVANLNKKIVQ